MSDESDLKSLFGIMAFYYAFYNFFGPYSLILVFLFHWYLNILHGAERKRIEGIEDQVDNLKTFAQLLQQQQKAYKARGEQ
jgi:hypothetical protein